MHNHTLKYYQEYVTQSQGDYILKYYSGVLIHKNGIH